MCFHGCEGDCYRRKIDLCCFIGGLVSGLITRDVAVTGDLLDRELAWNILEAQAEQVQLFANSQDGLAE